MSEQALPEEARAAAPPAASAGTLLAQAREAAGLTIDDVAMQLKLAPRQVVAIERDDFASLPGRTFIRGFVRNYARLLKLDVDAVIAALPGDGAAPAPERSLVPGAARTIGEMPREGRPRPGIARWAIPLVLIAIVGGAAYYEFSRLPAPGTPAAGNVEPATTVVPAPATPAAPPADAPEGSRTGGSAGSASQPSTSELPNPLANASSAPPPAAPPVATLSTPPAQESASAAPAAMAAPGGALRNQLVLVFRGTSWIEVRDRSGNVVLSITGTQGATRELPVATPGEVIIGNAAVVDTTWRGRPVDLAPHTKQNVARVKLD